MAGHSKWAQIKHKKAITDTKRGKLFSKLVKEIVVAARDGTDPESNHKLRSAIERAKSAGLPKQNIERAIERAAGGKEGANLQEFLYEASGFGGVQILIEGITDNTNRTSAEIKHILSKYGAKLAQPNSLLWNFEKVGIINVPKDKNLEKLDEQIELSIIDSGAKDFEKIEDTYLVQTEFADLEPVRRALCEQGIFIQETGHDFKAKHTIEISDLSQRQKLEQLLDALLENDDVQEVYTNLKNQL